MDFALFFNSIVDGVFGIFRSILEIFLGTGVL